MTSHDVREVLNLPVAGSAPRPPKKQKVTGPRAKMSGLARELQMLGGDTPISIIQDQGPRGKKRPAGRSNGSAKAWILKPFTNSARKDGLVLRHWQQKEPVWPAINEDVDAEGGAEPADPIPEVGESTFAKFNVRIERLKYTDAEYDSLLRSEEWTRDETDYLVDLVAEYDLRWPIIIDRYEYTTQSNPQQSSEPPKVRDMEDLKARYYDISAKMLSHKRPVHSMNEAEYKLHEAYQNFNPDIERRRKEYARSLLQRSKEEAKEEENLLIELRRIIARSERLNEERNELYARLDAPMTPANVNMAQFTQSAALQQLVGQLVTADKNRKRKSIPGEVMSPSINIPAMHVSDRRDSSRHDSLGGPSSVGKKAGAGPDRRKLTDEEEHLYGVTHHDRLTHGSLIRSEKATKAINGKSAAHATKVLAILAELGLPARLHMPTMRVVAEFEALVAKINLLLDAKKVADKLEAEITLARRLKAEREEQERQARATGPGGSENQAEQGLLGEWPGGGGGAATNGKRSASVLSSVSDKSTKRQKK